MRITAWPTYYKLEEGIAPLDAQDIDLRISVDELEALAAFMTQTARNWRQTGVEAAKIDFGDSKPNPQTGICITVMRDD